MLITRRTPRSVPLLLLCLLAPSLAACATTAPKAREVTLRSAIKKVPPAKVPKDVAKGLGAYYCAIHKPLAELRPIPWMRPLYDYEMQQEGATVIDSDSAAAAVFGCQRDIDWRKQRLLLVWWGMSDHRPVAFKAPVRHSLTITFHLQGDFLCRKNSPLEMRAARMILLPADGSTIYVRRAMRRPDEPCRNDGASPKVKPAAAPAAPKPTPSPSSKK